jgi:hypothetical protein
MDYDVSFRGPQVSDGEVEEARWRKSRHVFENFVEPVTSGDGREVFSVSEVRDELWPPYSYREVKDALEYASGELEIYELVEEDMDLFMYTGLVF